MDGELKDPRRNLGRWMADYVLKTAVILPVDAGATAEVGSMLPKEAMTNPGGRSDVPQ